jgi:ketosteroid isomerase-like protein
MAMTTKLTGALASYYAAVNGHDIESVLALFTSDAIVKDEGTEHRGHDAIRAWMQATARKYGRLEVEPTVATQSGRATVVTSKVSGDFKGSPALLRYTFTVERESIARLEIA